MANDRHAGEEPIGWVTVKGKHFPKWKDGTIGWQNGQDEKPSKRSDNERDLDLKFTKNGDTLDDMNNMGKLGDIVMDAPVGTQIYSNDKYGISGYEKISKEGLSGKWREISAGLYSEAHHYAGSVDDDEVMEKLATSISNGNKYKIGDYSPSSDSSSSKTTSKNARYDTSRSKNNKTESKDTAASLGTMSKEDRRKFLDEAPAGTKLSGLYDLRTGSELTVEKQSGYSDVFTRYGTREKLAYNDWYIAGVKQPLMSRTLREAAEGTNKYYTTDKKIADAKRAEYEKKSKAVNGKGTMTPKQLMEVERRRDKLWDKEDHGNLTAAEKKELKELESAISKHYNAKNK